jgi:hypothetical protein
VTNTKKVQFLYFIDILTKINKSHQEKMSANGFVNCETIEEFADLLAWHNTMSRDFEAKFGKNTETETEKSLKSLKLYHELGHEMFHDWITDHWIERCMFGIQIIKQMIIEIGDDNEHKKLQDLYAMHKVETDRINHIMKFFEQRSSLPVFEAPPPPPPAAKMSSVSCNSTSDRYAAEQQQHHKDHEAMIEQHAEHQRLELLVAQQRFAAKQLGAKQLMDHLLANQQIANQQLAAQQLAAQQFVDQQLANQQLAAQQPIFHQMLQPAYQQCTTQRFA